MKILRLFVLALTMFAPPVLAAEHTSTSSDLALPSEKILGGTESKQGDWPWMTALLHSNQPDMYNAQYCSGVLIDERWVLTAAHCVDGMTRSEVEVAVGVFDLNNFSGSRIAVKSIHIHPQYNSNIQNDIALLELNSPSSQPTIPLFSGESEENAPPSMLDRMVTAIGWGMADGTSQWYWPNKLRQVDLPVVADSNCNDIYINSPSLIASQLCAGYPEYTWKDTCNGDSGGPIVAQIDGAWVHVGLVSYGSSCNQAYGWYGVYSRTSGFVDFISQYVPGAQFTSPAHPTLSWLTLLLNESTPKPTLGKGNFGDRRPQN